MFGTSLRKLALAAGLVLASSAAALANEVDIAKVHATCTGYTFSAAGKYLEGNDQYEVKYWFGLKLPDGTISDIDGSLPVKSQDENGDFKGSISVPWGPLGSGRYKFAYGHATLIDDTTGVTWNTVYITFKPKCFKCNSLCTAQTSNVSNFNGTAINPGTYIWFNSNMKLDNIPSNGGTMFFTNQTITFTAGGVNYTLPVPDSQVTLTSSVDCTTTTFDTKKKQWVTNVPLKGDDEIFLSGLSYLVPAGFGQVTGNVTWSGTFSTAGTGMSAQWKWGAAVYSQFSTDYNALAVKGAHQTSCMYGPADHAGTPEGTDSNGVPWKKYVIGGARGGGGSNFTGSWSGTVNSTPVCNKSKA